MRGAPALAAASWLNWRGPHRLALKAKSAPAVLWAEVPERSTTCSLRLRLLQEGRVQWSIKRGNKARLLQLLNSKSEIHLKGTFLHLVEKVIPSDP